MKIHRLAILTFFILLLVGLSRESEPKVILQSATDVEQIVLGENTVESKNRITVERVIDGDTIEVRNNNILQKVRIIGIDTPESVNPRKPIECFGKDASIYAEQLLLKPNSWIELEIDPTQDDKDRYGRLLRYITIHPQEIDFGYQMIRDGYAYAYVYKDAFMRTSQYQAAQREASEQQLGLWGVSGCAKKE